MDKAEPSEALKCNVVWSLGISNPTYLLSSLQLARFRKNLPIKQEIDVKAEKGAYFVVADMVIAPNSEEDWMIVGDLNKDHSAIVALSKLIQTESDLETIIEKDIKKGTAKLINLVAASDGLQLSADNLRDTRHFSNSLFNIMRGGIFDDNYQIDRSDFKSYFKKANREVYRTYKHEIKTLADVFMLSDLKILLSKNDNVDFKRICQEYMPLKFSRRHGDPSRPWNQFSINTKSESDGSKILDYEGNWRDIFQNWEALAHSYPEFVESMIHKFLNASTFDGYNPYRVTKDGIDWETIEPDDPWAYIGYWGDHQIIYLLKFLEIIQDYYPGQLQGYFDQSLFVYANVPYKIKSHQDILKNSKDTIEFDLHSDERIREKRSKIGADGALLEDKSGSIIHVNLIEKLLATLLAKMSNLIPEGGIWMNTQRPEWNDANNALVGNGVSMVTLYYLRRFFIYFNELLAESTLETVEVSGELLDMYNHIHTALKEHQDHLSGAINDTDRKIILDALGEAASAFRQKIYNQSFSGNKSALSINDLKQFVEISLQYLEHSIRANKREDRLYHAYNLMTVEDDAKVSIAHLSEMLEGQVAVLSSGYLSSQDALDLLDSLKSSALFREDQYSYILYPNKQLPGFLEKNRIAESKVKTSDLLMQLVVDGNNQILERDINNHYHFNGNFKNAQDLELGLGSLSVSKYSALVKSDKAAVLGIFEEVFNHKAFTGRSGTFYGYEGLGSIYWHMVSKLLLAVQEVCLKAVEEKASDEVIGRLLEHYYEINEGIGVHKSPKLYGAFPTDPYSHTPAGKGAQQPGMTGQVKEDILCRFGELGVFVSEGKLYFNPCLLRKDEFLTEATSFIYVDVHSERREIKLDAGALCFTYCQVPIIYRTSDANRLEVVTQDGQSQFYSSLNVNIATSKDVFERSGNIDRIIVDINGASLG